MIVRDSDLAARRHRQGINIDFRDTAIAAIAIARSASLATRNRRHFADLELPLLDPGPIDPPALALIGPSG